MSLVVSHDSNVQYVTEIREAHVGDVSDIHALILEYADQDLLLPRSIEEIIEQLTRFEVLTVGNTVVACASLEIFTDRLCEIRSLAVMKEYSQQGFGRILVESLCTKAANMGFSTIMALTYVPGFFHKLGFVTVPKATFPEKVWGVCFKCSKFSDCTEIAVQLKLN